MRQVQVDVVLANKLISAREAGRVVRAIEKQVKRDFADVWEVTADLALVTSAGELRKGAWQLALLDEDSPDAVGYHQLTRDGMPLGKVFLRAAMQCETGWPSAASHELLEMLVNPAAQSAVFLYDDDVGGRVYPYEVCDPCQDDTQCYRVDGVWVSDFVYPAWFETWRKPRSTRFDHARKLTRALQIARGGYVSFYDARRREWVSDYGKHFAANLMPVYGFVRGGSRRALRQLPRHQWKKSKR